MLSKEEVGHIAKLARLELTEQETEKMQKDLSSILEYFNILKKVPALGKKKAGEGKDMAEVTRKDEVIGRRNGLAEDLLRQAPASQDGYVKVKSIL